MPTDVFDQASNMSIGSTWTEEI